MVKYTQTIRRQTSDELFEYVWPFVGLARKGLILNAPRKLFMWWYLINLFRAHVPIYLNGFQYSAAQNVPKN